MASGFNSSTNPPAKRSKALSIANANELTFKMSSIFSEIEDPRVERNRVHLLTDILIIAILSVIAGAKGWEDMENYGLSKYEWLEQFLKLPEGIPCADTFRRVLERINPKVFEQCFRRWVESIVETVGAQVIPIDGKTLKGSYDRVLGKTALHLVTAWSSQHRLVLGQVKVADKSNEITAIPALLELFVRTGHAPQNLSLLRRIALNALNLGQSFKRSNRQKSHRAAMDNNIC